MHRALRHVLVASAVGASLVLVGAWLSGCVVETYPNDVSGGGQGGCTLIGGTQGITLQVAPAVAGSYDIVVRSSVIEAQCSFSTTGRGDIRNGTCITRTGVAYPLEPGSRGGGDYIVDLMTESSSVPPPAALDVQVFDAEANEIFHETLTPTYTSSYPNGESCDGTGYLHASEIVYLPSPNGTPRFDGGTKDAGLDAEASDAADAAD